MLLHPSVKDLVVAMYGIKATVGGSVIASVVEGIVASKIGLGMPNGNSRGKRKNGSCFERQELIQKSIAICKKISM
ncbi:hypothetical protein Ancab_033952, partial [Ancistrocladus abbreviatus]